MQRAKKGQEVGSYMNVLEIPLFLSVTYYICYLQWKQCIPYCFFSMHWSKRLKFPKYTGDQLPSLTMIMFCWVTDYLFGAKIVSTLFHLYNRREKSTKVVIINGHYLFFLFLMLYIVLYIYIFWYVWFMNVFHRCYSGDTLLLVIILCRQSFVYY